MSLRWIILLLAAATTFAAEYKASDDGRVVYFTGIPAGDLIPSRLWRWSNGNIQTLLESPQLRLLRLSSDGRFALIQSANRWLILLDGSSRPLAEINDAQLASMSPNGRWVVIYRNQPGRAIELFELSEAGLRSTAVWPDPRPSGMPFSLNLDFPAMVSDDAVVRVTCAMPLTSCLWDSKSGSTQPHLIPFDGTARAFYQWREELPSRRSVLFNAAGDSLGITCTDWFAAIVATDPTGRQAHLRCGAQDLLYNADTNTTTNVLPESALNSTLTAILARPTARQFTWQPLSSPAPEPISRFDSTEVVSAPSPTGLFATSQTPDFTLEWGGQTLSWIQGSLGYHYAFLPSDIVPGAVDSFRLTSLTRPWLNVQRDRVVDRDALAVVPVNAADPRFLFIHQDYSGLVTPDSPARPGEHVHLYITGIDPTEIDSTHPNSFAALFGPRNSIADAPQLGLPLRTVAVQPTAYSRNLQLLTLEVPRNIGFTAAPTQTLLLALQLSNKAGDVLSASGLVWFSITPD